MKKNFIYSFLYEMVVAIYPILMIPYVSYTLGKNGVGIYSYTYAILGFFLLFCQLGVNLCGTRVIAQTRDDKKLMTKKFKSIFFIQLCASIFSISAYLIYITQIAEEYKFYSYLLIPFLIGQSIRISWFYLGIEDIKKICIRNIGIRILSAVGIFIFVRDENELPLYFIIMSVSYLIGDISVWPNAIRYLEKEPFSWDDAKGYIVPMIKMFMPLLALKGAYYIDEIMLGTMHKADSVAIYENNYKIVNMLLQIYTVLSNVLSAHASHLVATNKIEKNIQYILNSIDLSSALMIPVILGLIAIAPELIPWYMGRQFLESIDLMRILPIVLIFSGISSILRTQYFVPMGKDNKYIATIVIGVVINICLNMLLIPHYSYMGAAIGTVVSEGIILCISVFSVNRENKILKAFRYFGLYVTSALIMGAVVRCIGWYLGAGIITNLVQICIGGLIYILIVLVIQKIFCKKDVHCLYFIIKKDIKMHLQKG